MGWAIGYDTTWNRDIGYGVPAICDHPDCDEEIDRGLSYVCADNEPYGGEHGCGLYFCSEHMVYHKDEETGDGFYCCERCAAGKEPFEPKPDTEEWINHKMTDPSWAKWREEVLKEELRKWYIDTIGYDPFEDDPTITVEEVAKIKKEYLAEGGGD